MASSSRASDRQSKEKLISDLVHLKNQIQACRSTSIKEKLEKNKKELRAYTAQRSESVMRTEPEAAGFTLSCRSCNPYREIRGWEPLKEPADMESVNLQEVIPSESSLVVESSSGGGRISVPCIKLPFVEKLPRYTTWIFLDK